MQQLTGLDASFLALESPTSYAHVGSVCVLEPPVDGQPLTLEKLTRLVESRLHLVPPLRRRLAEVPLGLDQPYWIEDPHFDIEFHVRELALPAPGDDHQLAIQAARLHSRPLDRRRPLWELYLIHGLQGGRYGVYTKVHHAAIDGVSGNDLLAALLDQTPEPRDVGEPSEWKPDTPPSNLNLLARSAVSAAKLPVRAVKISADVVRAVPGVLRSPGRPAVPVLDQVLGRESDGQPLLAPSTPFNTNIGPHRRWVFGCIPLADVKAVKNAAGATVNDVVMSLCAAALRSWLQRHDALPDGPLLAAVPVSIRSDDQQNTHGNRVAVMIAAIPTHLGDPAARLAAAHQGMAAAKENYNALPADIIGDITQFSVPALSNTASRLASELRLLSRAPAFNLFISNVPGPTVDLYYCGARLEACYPLSVLADGQALNITVLSIAGNLNFGIIADRDVIPDVEPIMTGIADEMVALKKGLALD